MDVTSAQCRVRKCSKCPGDREYYCATCECNLCLQCKENHVKDLITIDHFVVVNRSPKQEFCVKHPGQMYQKYCKTCEVPVCYHCRKHRTHKQLNVMSAYSIHRQQLRETIHTLRSEALFYRSVLLSGIKTDFKTCPSMFSFSHYNCKILTKAQTLIKHINSKLCRNLKHRCLNQIKVMNGHISSMQALEHVYEESATCSLKFLSSFKTACLLQVHLKRHTRHIFMMTESLQRKHVFQLLSQLKTSKKGMRHVGNECLLKLLPSPSLHQSLKVIGFEDCNHISYLASNKIWVSGFSKKPILTNKSGRALGHSWDSALLIEGSHTVNSNSEFIYIDKYFNINKMSKGMKTTVRIMHGTNYKWEPTCVYWSPCSGVLLVGMFCDQTRICKVIRYNQTGQLAKIAKQTKTPLDILIKPIFITENNNGDVVVSFSFSHVGSVVVTERGGRHRFTYQKHPSGSKLNPYGICTDALSHILVCDKHTNTVLMLDKDGQFLSYLLIRPSGIFCPHSLSYDVNTHRLWVGSGVNNTVCVYSFIIRQDAYKDSNQAIKDETKSLSEVQTDEKSPNGNEYLLEKMPCAKLHEYFKVPNVDSCHHISCVTPDRVWVSDKNNLIFTNTTGDILHCLEDSISIFGSDGSHTVNSDNELFYINLNDNIKRLSWDLKMTTTFFEKKHSKWTPQCVHSSLSTGDLLVGLFGDTPLEGIVFRFNQTGQRTQRIKESHIGVNRLCRRKVNLYRYPIYITENKNGDVLVSDSNRAVVVTDHEGKHRFDFTGHPPGINFDPQGVCTDVLSNILVCGNDTVQMLDKNGRFLSYLLKRPPGIFSPTSLSYDVNTHRLWVGCRYKYSVCVYNYTFQNDTETTIIDTKSSGEIRIRENKKPEKGNAGVLKVMLPPKLLKSFTVTLDEHGGHISSVALDKFWVNEGNKLILMNKKGDNIHELKDLMNYSRNGIHTVNSDSELFFIDKSDKINKVSKDMKTITTFKDTTDSPWRPLCVYWGPYSGDLLVGMYRKDTEYKQTNKINRYNQTGQLTQSIPRDETQPELYGGPKFITENNNEDIVVSDSIFFIGAVVVTESGGRHRFSYTGHPAGLGIDPLGVCTDALSHILICDSKSKTIHMVDRNGQFLSHLVGKSKEIGRPLSLSYNANTNYLYVKCNKVCVYGYLTKQDDLSGSR